MKILFVLDYDKFNDNLLEAADNVVDYADMIWFRVRNRSDNEIYEKALLLRQLMPKSTLLLSERADIAVAASFNGVHLNANTLPPIAVKQAFPRLTVGYSAHSVDETFIEGADYVTLSPIFETVKSYTVVPLGEIPAPHANVFAMGGVKPENIESLKTLGYKGIAGISLYNTISEIHRLCKKDN